jgi:predicted dienelactone hydrolase
MSQQAALTGRASGEASRSYDSFVRGPFPAGVRTLEARDAGRSRTFPCEVWYPAADRHIGQDLEAATQDFFTVGAQPGQRKQMAVRDADGEPGTYPLIVFSHHSGGNRRAATFLTTHLASHGYMVAALDHSEIVAPELARREGETAGETLARAEKWIANRVPDMRFLIGRMLSPAGCVPGVSPDPSRVGIVGHSFGGWTALASPDAEPRISAVVALAPAGASNPRPGILRAKLDFDWDRNVPVLLLAADLDTPLPLAGMYEIFERIPSAKQMVILSRADHCHFMDDVEQAHEGFRSMPFPAQFAWMAQEMLPISELCTGDQAHLFVRSLALAHFDAVLKEREQARRWLAGDIEDELARRGVGAVLHKP